MTVSLISCTCEVDAYFGSIRITFGLGWCEIWLLACVLNECLFFVMNQMIVEILHLFPSDGDFLYKLKLKAYFEIVQKCY